MSAMTEHQNAAIRQLVTDHNIKSVVDIQCGDFSAMWDIVFSFDHYIGCDVDAELIEHNKRYSNDIISFQTTNAVTDEIPTADLLIVRDLFEHLSHANATLAIQNILKSGCTYLLASTQYNPFDPEYPKLHVNVDSDSPHPVCLGSDPFKFPVPEVYLEGPAVSAHDVGVRKGLGLWKIENLKTSLAAVIPITNVTENLTVVTGLWNINRTGRDFSHYIEHFKKFLEMPVNMFIYVPRDLEYLVWERRNKSNTCVRLLELDDIKSNYYKPFWDKTQEIRTNPEWLNQTGEGGWLRSSPQATIEWYNPIVQSKMFMLHDAKVMNPFDTDYFIWLDAAITHTVYDRYFTEHRCLDKIIPFLKTFLFLSYPYEANTEIHGFEFEAMNTIARQKVEYVCRGGLFGGHKDYISMANGTYYSLLNQTLAAGYMGTEESIFSIMAYHEPHIYKRYALDGNGLIVKFVQALLDDAVEFAGEDNPIYNGPKGIYLPEAHKTSLYVLSFNFPEQFQTLIDSFELIPEWLDRPRKILINNSTDPEVIAQYDPICQKYGFEHIVTGENLGINRGRMYAARHFHESDSDYYFFFEDDMCLHSPMNFSHCRNGFRRAVPLLYDTVHHIMAQEQFDFLKLSFTEVYMDNNIQVSWYNVPQAIRTERWPEYDKLPVSGLDPFAPRTHFDRIGTYNGLSYITGEIYYANWPMIVSREGNKKMFMTTEWPRPYEQTWMSYVFQETIAGNIKPAVLLAAPINHNRICHYNGEDRREN